MPKEIVGLAVEEYREKIEVNKFVHQSQEAVESSNMLEIVYVHTKEIVSAVGDVVDRRSVAEISDIATMQLRGRDVTTVGGVTTKTGFIEESGIAMV
jgi:hypothetical protein